MTQTHKEICIALIGEAKTKQEVIEAMEALYPSNNQQLIKNYVEENWEKQRKNMQKISLCKKTFTEKYKIICNLLGKREVGQIINIYLYISGTTAFHMGHKVTTEMYNSMIGPELPGRKMLRGKKVKVCGLSRNRACIEVKYDGIKFHHNFTIWDINAKKGIEVLF